MSVRKGWSIIGVIALLICSSLEGYAQNTPYSERGLGEPVHSRNILNSAMGGVSEAYSDGQTLNFSNPASYANLRLTTLDAAFNMGYLNIRDRDTGSFRSGFGSLSYLQIGVPLKKGGGWGLVFGLVPETKVNYRIAQSDSLEDIGEHVSYLYEGKGGAYKAFVGTGVAIKGFRIGVNAGYLFGSKQLYTQTLFPSDSLGLFNSNQRERTGYGAFFGDAGIQTNIKLGQGTLLTLGASGGLQTNLKANRDYFVESYDPSDRNPKYDTAFYADGEKGTITYPAHYGAGFLFQSTKGKGSWTLGADYHTTQWSDYTYYGADAGLNDSRSLRFGVQFIPATGARTEQQANVNFWQLVAYRAGFYTLRKNFESDNAAVDEYAFSLGFGFPIRNFTRTNQFTLINTALEVGKRGNKSNRLNSSFIRLSVGFSFSDIWFIANRYQ